MALNGLPRVGLSYTDGALGQTISSADGLLCIAVCGAVAVDTTFALAKAYSIRKLSDLAALGITVVNNPLLYNTVADFFAEAADGTKVYIIGYPATLKMSDILNKENPYLKSIIESTNGEIRGFAVTSVSAVTPTIVDGLDNDLSTAMLNAQALGMWALTSRYAPVFFVLDGLNYSGVEEDLKDLTTYTYYRVAVVIGSRTAGAANQAIGLVAGRLAAATIDQNIGRGSAGALNVETLYSKNTLIENADGDTVYNKSYITFRQFTGIAGYYIADDLTATAETSDYNHLTAVRTIDKAARLAYATVVTNVLEELEVNADGTMKHDTIVSWQEIVKNGVTGSMSGELSSVDDDKGVQVYIDPEQDVVATSTFEIDVRVRPFGYARYINIKLGFTVNS